MAASDFQIYKSLKTARISPSDQIANAAAVIAQETQYEDKWRAANLSANIAEEPIGVVKYRANLISASITSSKAAVANATDYSVITLSKRTGANAAVVMGTANLASVAVTAFVPIALTLVANAANTQIAAGDVLTLTSVNTGNGIANNGVGSLSLVWEDT